MAGGRQGFGVRLEGFEGVGFWGLGFRVEGFVRFGIQGAWILRI